MAEKTTLIIKHLPSELSIDDREELLKLFGAVEVYCMPDDLKMKHTAFATFATTEEAKYALSKLHQLEILNRRLVVEIAKKHQNDIFKESKVLKPKSKQVEETVPKTSEKENIRLEMEEFSRNLHGIAPTLGLDYLPSPMLKYKYPDPTPNIISNIAHALAAVPKFYTQVLHLMNKMNLPAPFGPVTPTPPLAPDPPTALAADNQSGDGEVKADSLEVEEMELTASDEESELESDTDVEHRKPDVILPLKRQAEKGIKKRKKARLQHLLPSNTLSSSLTSNMPRPEPSDIFEVHSQVEGQKKIQFNIKPSLEPESAGEELQSTKSNEQSGFGIITAPKAQNNASDLSSEPGEDIWKNSKFITSDELRRKRISQREMKTLSVFRNFSPGEPTVRLYIKNLARQVEEKDLRYIFGRFINRNNETERNMFDVRLMKDGRMKGQAFVTLADEKQAIEAVKETNGFVLHTKPLVVQFARSAKPKETPNKQSKKI